MGFNSGLKGLNWSMNLFACLLTPLIRVLLEKLTGSQLVKKFPAFYGTLRFIIAFPSNGHMSLTWARLIQSIHPPSHFLKIHLFSILPSTPGSSKLVLAFGVSPPKLCIHLSPYVLCSSSLSSRFYYMNNIRGGVQIVILPIM
jgi:hypothetical protein